MGVMEVPMDSNQEAGMNVYIRHMDETKHRLLARVANAEEAERLAASVEKHGWYVDEQTHEDAGGVSTQYVAETALVGGEDYAGFEIIVGTDR